MNVAPMKPGLRTSRTPVARVDVLRSLGVRYAVVLPFCVAVASASFYAAVRRHYVRDWERRATDVAGDLNQDLLRELGAPGRPGLVPSSWEAAGLLPHVDVLARHYLRQLDIVQINVFDTNRRVVFSTRPDLRGRVSVDNAKLDAALRGETVSDIEHAEQAPDFADARHSRDVLETYVPLRPLDAAHHPAGGIVGAFEIYQDVTPMQASLARLGYLTLAGSLAVLGFLGGVLIAVGRQVSRMVQGERSVRERLEADLEHTVERLEDLVTERTAEVARERETLRTVLDAAPSAFVMLDASAKIVYVNRRFRSLCRVQGDCVGRACNDVWPSGSACDRCAARATLRDGQPHTTLQSRLQPDGWVVWLEHTAAPITLDGHLQGVLEMISDVTERRRTEENLARTARLASVGEVAATVAHEVRNAATTTKLVLQLLAERISLPMPDARSLDAALRATSRMEALVENLLRLARPSPPTRLRVHLADVLRVALDMVRPEAHRRGVRFVEPGDDALAGSPMCMGDSALLTEAFLNLLLNAVQAFEAVAAAPRREVAVRIVADEMAGTVVIEVHDTGCGLSDLEPSRIFEPFFTTKPGGTGLGLAIVLRIVSAHGGTVELAPAPGGGAIARVTLPVAPQAGLPGRSLDEGRAS